MCDSQLWSAYHKDRQEKKAHNRESGRGLLEQKKISYTAKNGGAHLIVEGPKGLIDYWPGTGLWMERGTARRRRGVRHLIRYVLGEL